MEEGRAGRRQREKKRLYKEVHSLYHLEAYLPDFQMSEPVFLCVRVFIRLWAHPAQLHDSPERWGIIFPWKVCFLVFPKVLQWS